MQRRIRTAVAGILLAFAALTETGGFIFAPAQAGISALPAD